MISSDFIRGYNDLIILSILKESDSYGYLISKTIRERTKGQYIIKETTLYSAFNRLDQNGLITHYYGDESSGSRRTYYKITDLGKVFLNDKTDEWKITSDVVNIFLGGNHQ